MTTEATTQATTTQTTEQQIAATATTAAASDAATTQATTTAQTQQAATTTLTAEQQATQAAPVKWPETWRADWSGGDEKIAKMLERLSDPGALVKSYAEAANKIRSGELAKPLAKDATPEQVAEWRKGNGIPEKPDGYFEQMPNGLVIGEDDKALFTEFAAAMHETNASPAQMHKAIEWYYGMQDDALAKAAQADKEQATKATDTLRQDWGGDYRANINVAMSFLDTLGPDLKPLFMDATLPDGTRMFNNPDILKWIVGQAREINPVGPVVPGGGTDQIQSITNELNGLKSMMSNESSEYWKGPKADANQARYRQLVEAQAKLQARGRAA